MNLKDMVEDFIALTAASAAGAMNPPKILGRTQVEVEGGIFVISTVVTCDGGPETAILDAQGTHPVEQYKTEEEANTGHAKWVEKVKTTKTIIKLGYGLSIKEEEVQLIPGTVT